MTRSLLMFGQGMVRSHPHVLGVLQAIERNDLGAFSRHVRGTVSDSLRLVFSSAGDDIGRYTKFFALSSTLSLTLGKGLKRNEFLSGKYADLMRLVLTARAVEWQARQYPEDELIARTSIDQCLHELSLCVKTLVENHPNSLRHSLLARFCGVSRTASAPWDVHSAQIATEIACPESPLRQRMQASLVLTHPTVSLIERAIREQDLQKKDDLLNEIIQVDTLEC